MARTRDTEHALHNREMWNQRSDEYQATHGPQLAAKGGLAWGVWQLAEDELRVLGDVRDRDEIAWPVGADHPGRELVNEYWALHRHEEPGEPIDFQLRYGEWIELFVENEFAVESLIEPRPPADARSSYRDSTDLDWARRWPMEHIWRVRRVVGA